MQRSEYIESLSRAVRRGDIIEPCKSRAVILYVDTAFGAIVAALRVAAVVEHLGKEALYSRTVGGFYGDRRSSDHILPEVEHQVLSGTEIYLLAVVSDSLEGRADRAVLVPVLFCSSPHYGADRCVIAADADGGALKGDYLTGIIGKYLGGHPRNAFGL